MKLCLFYNMVNGCIDFPSFPSITTVRDIPFANCIRSVNSKSYFQPFAKSNTFLNSFFPSTIRHWNSLPNTVHSISTLPTFKRTVTELLS